MRLFGYSVMCSLCALIMGVLLVMWPEAAMIYLVITVGVLFLLPGLYGIFAYFASRSRAEDGSGRAFPIVALGSALRIGRHRPADELHFGTEAHGKRSGYLLCHSGLALAGGYPDFSKPIRSRKNPLHRIRRIFHRLRLDRPFPHHPLPEEEQSGDNGCGSDRGVRISDFASKKCRIR